MKKLLVAVAVGLTIVACGKKNDNKAAQEDFGIDYATAKARADKNGVEVKKESQLIGVWTNADEQATSRYQFKGTGEAVYSVLVKTTYEPDKGEVKHYSGDYIRFSVVGAGLVQLVFPGNQLQQLKMRLLAETEEHPELLIVGEGEEAELYYRTMVVEH